MSYTDFRCKHCGQTRPVATSRITGATFIRCDACFAISSLTLSDRLALVNAASDAPTMRSRASWTGRLSA